MNRVVLDASIALAWCFPDEASEHAEKVLVALERATILVPSIWGLEIANAILVGERRKRLNQPEVRQFMTLMEGLVLTQDAQTAARHVQDVLPLARSHGLSAYDAAYLELSMRHSAALATLDDRLKKAAKTEGVTLFDV